MENNIVKVQIIQEEVQKIGFSELFVLIKKEKYTFIGSLIVSIFFGLLSYFMSSNGPDKWVARSVVSPVSSGDLGELNRAYYILSGSSVGVKDFSEEIFIKFKNAVADKDFLLFGSKGASGRFSIKPVGQSSVLYELTYEGVGKAESIQQLTKLTKEVASELMIMEEMKVKSLLKIKQEEIKLSIKFYDPSFKDLAYRLKMLRAENEKILTGMNLDLHEKQPFIYRQSPVVNNLRVNVSITSFVVLSILASIVLAILICTVKYAYHNCLRSES